MANNQTAGSELNRMLAEQQRLMQQQAAGELRLFQNLAGGAVQSLESVQKAAVKTAQNTARAAAKAAGSVVRYVASFDELERLPEGKTGTSGGSSGSRKGSSSASKKSSAEEKSRLTLADLLVRQLKKAKREWDRFWKHLDEWVPVTVAAWSAAWQSICAAAKTAWSTISATAGSLWQGTLLPMGQWLLQTFVPWMVEGFSRAFAPIVQGAVPAALQAFTSLFVTACQIVQSMVRTVVAPAFSLILSVWLDMMTGIQTAWAEFGQPILTGFVQAAQNLAGLCSNLWNTVLQPILVQLVEWLGVLWEEHLQPLWDQLTRMFAAFVNLILNLWNNVLMPFLNWLVSVFGPLFTDLFGAAGNVVMQVAGTIAEAVNTVSRILQGLITFLTNVFAGNWDAAWQSIGNSMAKVGDGIRATLRGVVNSIISLVNGMVSAVVGAVNAVGRALNTLSFTVPDWVPFLGGNHVGFHFGTLTAPQIPYLASGGVIRQPTLAMMGEYAGAASDPEIAAPQSAIAQAVSDANGDVVDAVLTAAEQIINAIRENGGEIVIGDEVIGRAARRYNSRQAIIKGGAVY